MKKNVLIINLVILFILGGLGIYKLVSMNAFKYADLETYTYSFTGKSKTFSFENGKVHFSEEQNSIVINKFKLDSDAKNINKAVIVVYFNDNYWSSNNFDIEEGIYSDVNKFLKSVQFVELDGNSSGTSDSFTKINKDNFKDSIKIVIDYCFVESTCQTEEFVISFSN